MKICFNCVETYLKTDLIEYYCPECETKRMWNRKKIEKLRLTAIRTIEKGMVRPMNDRAKKAHIGILSFLSSK